MRAKENTGIDQDDKEGDMSRRLLKIDVDRVLDNVNVAEDARKPRAVKSSVTPRAKQIAAKVIELFNVHGASRLSINRVAAELGISAGNLHYHFRTNSDLYRVLFDILNEDVRAILTRPKMPMKLEDVVQHQIDIQRCLWRHRYFFRDLDYLMHSDEVIFVEFIQLQSWAVDQLVALQDFYRTNFNLRPMEPPNSGLEVAQNCWMMWISWIRWEAIANGHVVLDEPQLKEVFHRLAWHHFSLHMPFMSQRVGFAIANRLKKVLLAKA